MNGDMISDHKANLLAVSEVLVGKVCCAGQGYTQFWAGYCSPAALRCLSDCVSSGLEAAELVFARGIGGLADRVAVVGQRDRPAG